LLAALVGDFVDDVAARTPAPGAGAVTGLCATLAAALATMVARFSTDEPTAATCQRLQQRLAPLADADADAYGAYLAAIRLPKDAEGRSEQISATLSAATDVPMQMVELASEVVEHAARLAREGNPRLRGDAVAAVVVGAAAARSAAALVGINLHGADDDRPRSAQAIAAAAQSHADALWTAPG
jgi:formiminotetrahydrofolate cyclodeaminase